jgi:hypothetical protein
MVMDGKISKFKNQIIRERLWFMQVNLALKRFKDDVKVAKGYDCGIKLKDTMISKKEMLLKLTMR